MISAGVNVAPQFSGVIDEPKVEPHITLANLFEHLQVFTDVTSEIIAELKAGKIVPAWKGFEASPGKSYQVNVLRIRI